MMGFDMMTLFCKESRGLWKLWGAVHGGFFFPFFLLVFLLLCCSWLMFGHYTWLAYVDTGAAFIVICLYGWMDGQISREEDRLVDKPFYLDFYGMFAVCSLS